MNVKKEILFRINLFFGGLCILSLFILIQVFNIQYNQGDELLEESMESVRIDTLEGERGNIYAEDGSLLATSLPFFEIRFDPNTDAITDEFFNTNVDSLAIKMSGFFKDRTSKEYKEWLVSKRAEGARYLLIRRKMNYKEVIEMRTWPIFERGRFRGGFITLQENKRVKPFGRLASRTLGYARTNVQPVGLEGAFMPFLKGKETPRVLKKMPNGAWVPLFEIESGPTNGKDIYTSVDVNLQDIADEALYGALATHKADHGCVIVMEVKTGKIRAISNLGMAKDSTYYEKYNYAIGEGLEPGSTFKLASLLALLREGNTDGNTKVDVEGGQKKWYGQWMRDVIKLDGEITLAEVMQNSSNVGIAKLIVEDFENRPEAFISHLEEMGITDKTGVSILGEPTPVLSRPEARQWSKVSLPWMSTGYEIKLTPLQMLNLYNAVANDGLMMKPYLVSEVKDFDRANRTFKPQKMQRICSKKVAKEAQAILEGIVEHKTGTNVKSDHIRLAGKTGTAKLAQGNEGYQKLYQASFAGYFPAEKPVYSCIVVINSPSMGQYYGSQVAAPVFKEIAEKYFANCYELHEPFNKKEESILVMSHPNSKTGNRQDLEVIFKELNVPYVANASAEMAVPIMASDTLELQNRLLRDNQLPMVVGMGLRDAIYVLENKGLKVKFTGKGKVQKQFPSSGGIYKTGDIVTLELT